MYHTWRHSAIPRSGDRGSIGCGDTEAEAHEDTSNHSSDAASNITSLRRENECEWKPTPPGSETHLYGVSAPGGANREQRGKKNIEGGQLYVYHIVSQIYHYVIHDKMSNIMKRKNSITVSHVSLKRRLAKEYMLTRDCPHWGQSGTVFSRYLSIGRTNLLKTVYR